MSQSHNFNNYRTRLIACEPPGIPLQSLVLNDLTLVDENPTFLENGWINFEKMLIIGKVYAVLKKFQSKPFEFRENPIVQHYLNNAIITYNDDQLSLGAKKAETVEEDKDKKDKSQKSKAKQKKAQMKKNAEKEKQERKKEQRLLYKKIRQALAEKETIELEAILTDRLLYMEFTSYLQKLLSNECLELYDLIHRYKRLNFNDKSSENCTKIKDFAQSIYEVYISPGGERFVTLAELPKISCDQLTNTTVVPDQTVFDAALSPTILFLKLEFKKFLKKVVNLSMID